MPSIPIPRGVFSKGTKKVISETAEEVAERLAREEAEIASDLINADRSFSKGLDKESKKIIKDVKLNPKSLDEIKLQEKLDFIQRNKKQRQSKEVDDIVRNIEEHGKRSEIKTQGEIFDAINPDVPRIIEPPFTPYKSAEESLKVFKNAGQLPTKSAKESAEVFQGVKLTPQQQLDVLYGKKPQMNAIKPEAPSIPEGSLGDIPKPPMQLPSISSPEAAGIAATGAGILGVGAAALNNPPQMKQQSQIEQSPESREQSPESRDVMSRLGLGQFNDGYENSPLDPLKPEQSVADSKQKSEQQSVVDSKQKSEQQSEEIQDPEQIQDSQELPKDIKPPVSEVSQAQELANLLAAQDNRGTFADVLKHRDLSVLANQLGQAGNIIGGAIARTGPNEAAQKLFGSNVALAQQGPEDFKQQILMDEHDPNSAVSKNYRAFLEKRGMSVGPGITAAQIRTVLLPTHEKEQNLKAKLKASESSAAEKRADRLQRSQEIDELKREKNKEVREAKAQQMLWNLKKNAQNTIGGPAGNTLRQRITSADAVFSTVGIDENNLTPENYIHLKDKFNDMPPQIVTELGVELNRMLSGGGVPAASTLGKLLPKNANERIAVIKGWFTGKLEPANQADFVKLVVQAAKRTKDRSINDLNSMVKDSFEGTNHIRNVLPEDYDAVYNSFVIKPSKSKTSTNSPEVVSVIFKGQKGKMPKNSISAAKKEDPNLQVLD